jgi:hypothetical protein
VSVQAKVKRKIEETRSYERSVNIELTIRPDRRAPQAEALTIVVTDSLPRERRSIPAVRLHVERRRKDGNRSLTGQKTFRLDGLLEPGGWAYDVTSTFDGETVDRLRELATQVLAEHAQINWENVVPNEKEN